MAARIGSSKGRGFGLCLFPLLQKKGALLNAAATIAMNKTHRLLAASIVIFVLFLSVLPIPTYAAELSDSTDLTGMDDYAWSVYKSIRAIAIPLAIVSFGMCGFKILGAIILGNPNMDMPKIKKQIFYTFIAVIAIAALPLIMSWAKSIVIVKPWTPPT